MKDYLQELDGNMSRWLPPVTKWMFYISIGVFLLFVIIGTLIPGSGGLFVRVLGASAATTLYQFNLWQLVTYAFMHGNFGHLFFNLLALYFFGQNLEKQWGSREYLKFSIFVTVGSVLFHLIVTLLLHRNSDVIIGISGLVYGVMAAVAVINPNAIVYVQFLIPIKMKYLVAIMGVMALLSSAGTSGSIAHLTHLGGLIFGYLAVKYPNVLDFVPLPRAKYKVKSTGRFR